MARRGSSAREVFAVAVDWEIAHAAATTGPAAAALLVPFAGRSAGEAGYDFLGRSGAGCSGRWFSLSRQHCQPDGLLCSSWQ